MAVVVLGANGLVGSALVREATERGREVIGTYHTERPCFDVASGEGAVHLERFDLREAHRIEAILKRSNPNAVINCAAMTDVDGCEANPDQARAVNAEAPGRIARACAHRSVPFVHFSTDYVFDGTANDLYDEEDEPNPLQVYGETKRAGERAVRGAHPEALVCRLSFVYGRHGATGELEGFPAWVIERAHSGESIPLFADQLITPTRAGDAATTALELIERGITGTLHVACDDCLTPYRFGRCVLERVAPSARERCERTSLADIDRPAPRPAYTCLATDKVVAALGQSRPGLDEDFDVLWGN